MPETVSCQTYIHGNYSSKDKLLLINPPVIETRYAWVKWNQPLDMLKLGSYLKSQIGCDVKLFDFMLPTNGRITRKAYKNEPEISVGNTSYLLWYYGKSFDDFHNYLDSLLPSWKPTAVWVTSLTSYWWRSICQLILNIKNRIQDRQVILYGNYPRLETTHAYDNSYADILVTDHIDLSQYHADFALYNTENTPSFCALDMECDSLTEEIRDKMKLGIKDFVFFNDDITTHGHKHFISRLKPVIEIVESYRKSEKPRFHGICGIYPACFTEEIACRMKAANFTELHFEYQTLDNGELDTEVYLKAKAAYEKAEFSLPIEALTGFINIGLPNDSLEQIIRHALNILEIFGAVIPKPYTPTPGTNIYEKYKSLLEEYRLEMLSPHLFPLAAANGLLPGDYDELYRLMAFLNYKVKQTCFNLFPPRIGFNSLKNTLEREIWKFGNG
ncbi:hypothetical protein GF312_04120 [Candidatus Poribacteria bacterium]|nr:hypothetical protein [Candidatus Poribacteria bacterium]